MPVNTEYDGYKLAVQKTTLVRDFGHGEFAIKPRGEVYLPRLGGQSQADYDNYLLRGFVIPAVEPTALAICGAIMRMPPAFEPLGAVNYLSEDIDGKETSLTMFVESMIKELLYGGSAGYLVEYTDKAVIKQYPKESIINYSKDYVVLAQEYQEADEKDKFIQHTKIEYIELTYDESGNYIQNIWRQDSAKNFGVVESFTPTNRGVALTEIPFVFSGELDNDPVLLHLATTNLDQYRMSTDQRWGLHWTALPTGFLFGDLRDDQGNKKQITVGAGSFNHIDDSDARVELLEFTGAGLSALKSAIDDNVKTMASIGAKMLFNGSSGVKSAETSRIEASSETATLSTIANTVDNTMAELLEILSEWMGAPIPDFKVNRDFIDIKLDPQALLAYLQVYQSGGMSLNSFLSLLVKGELLPKNVSALDEADRITTTGTDFSGFNGGLEEDEEDSPIPVSE